MAIVKSFNNFEELYSELIYDLVPVVTEVGNEVNELMKLNIMLIVYSPYDDMVRAYKPIRLTEGSFYDSWTTEVMFNNAGNGVNVKVFSDPELMELDFDLHRHGKGSDFQPGLSGQPEIDRRPDMDWIIAEGKAYDFYVHPNAKDIYLGPEDNWWTRPRDYFTPTTESLDKGELSSIAKRALINNGFDVAPVLVSFLPF